MGNLLQDLRFAARALRTRPLFTILVVVTLAVGIGVNAAMFSVVDTVLLEPLPYPNGDRLVTVWGITSSGGRNTISAESYQDYRSGAQTFDALAAWAVFPSRYVVTGGDEPQTVVGTMVSGNLFRALGTSPVLGRGLRLEDENEGAPQVVVLSHGFWQSRYGAQNVMGSTLMLGGSSRTIVGVMPPEASLFGDVDLWEPLRMSAPVATGRGNNNFRLFGRLAEGVSIDQANQEMKALAAGIEEQFPEVFEGWTVELEPLRDTFVSGVRSMLWMLLGAVGLVLLVTCANLAALLLTRAVGRHREVAVRLAMGASRARVARLVLTEALVLAMAGGVLGLGLAYGLIGALRVVAVDALPRIGDLGLDGSVLAFTALVTIGTGLLFGSAPAMQAPRQGLVDGLKEGGGRAAGRRTQWLQRGLVVVQVALSMVLVVGAGLLLRSFQQVRAADLGIQPAGLLTAEVRLPAEYGEDRPPALFWEEAVQQVRALAGVEAAAVAVGLPVISGMGPWNYVWAEGKEPATPAERRGATRRMATPGYFSTFGIPLRGRDFVAADGVDAPPVAIISESAAEEFFPDEDPIGRGLMLWGGRFEVVGVAGDVRVGGPTGDFSPIVYLALNQWSFATTGTLVLRTGANPSVLAAPLRETIRAVDANVPVERLQTMEVRLAGTVARDRLRTLVLGMFAGVALLLAALGLYGVLATYVARRGHELGIRMALGAAPRQVLATILRQSFGLVGAGLLVGVGLAVGTTRFLQGMLYGVDPLDPRTLVGTVIVLVVAALAAALVPGRRAMRVDPVASLRVD